MPAANSSVTIQLPDDIKKHLESLAETTGRSTDHLIVEALERYVAEEARLIEEIEAGLAELDAGAGVSQEEVMAGARQITHQARQQAVS